MAKRQSKTQSQKRAKGKAAEDAIELLTADHQRVKELFTKFESESSQDEKQAVARQVCEELVMHAVLEEDIFYAACREHGIEEQMLNEAQIEHDAAKVLIANVQMAEDSYFDAEVKVLKEYVLHHLAEEENARNGIFAHARAGGLDLAALGAQIKARKQELLELQEMNRLPRPSLKALQLPRLTNAMRMSGDNDMARQDEQYRNERDRYEDDDRYSRGSYYGRSRYDDERSSSRGNDRPRDDQGRFMSEDDRYGGSSRSSGRDDYRSSSRGEGRGQGGWFGDPEGHSEASRRGWEERGSSRSESRSSRYRDDDDDRGRSRSSRDDDRSQGGWFGDPEGHSEAARRGWEERSSSRSGNGSRGRMSMRDDDDDRGRSRGGRDDDRGQGGWFGDPRGHSEAARRGWEERGGSRTRGRDDDEDRGSRRGRDDDRGQGGWFGDPEGHSEASRRGWAQRR